MLRKSLKRDDSKNDIAPTSPREEPKAGEDRLARLLRTEQEVIEQWERPVMLANVLTDLSLSNPASVFQMIDTSLHQYNSQTDYLLSWGMICHDWLGAL